MRHQLLSFVAVIAIVAAVPATAAEIEASSQIDAVTVYPDGATVTRLIRLDLPVGDSTLFARAVTALQGVPLRLVSQAASRRNITFVLRDADVPAAMNRLHGAFFGAKVTS